MRSSTDTTTKTMLVLALLAALAVLLRLGENLLPLPVQLGAIRPGLANTITILCLYLFGLRLTGLFFDCPRSSGRTFEHRPFYTWFSYRPWRNAFKPAADGAGRAVSFFHPMVSASWGLPHIIQVRS